MRTSISQRIQGALMFTQNASDKLIKAQNHAVSGKRIMKPSDDVPGTNRALSLRSSINTVQQFTDNIVVSKPVMNATMNAMNDMVKAVREVRRIAVEAAKVDFSGSKETLARQLDGILSQLVDLANSKHTDKFLFSGTATETKPIVPSASGPQPYDYEGDNGTRMTKVLSWVSLPLNVPGDELFNFDLGAGAETTDMFTMVTQLRDKILTGTVDEISNELTNIDANLNNLLSHTARVGSWAARMEDAKSSLEDSEIRFKEMLSNVEDIDLTEAIVELKTQENVYQTALSITSRMLELSLASLKF